VQVASDADCYLVDPLAGLDLGPLLATLADRARPKVLHAARQDLEVLLNVGGLVPGPVFDTQVAAALLGLPPQVGYADLIARRLGHSIDKGQTRTDWSRRPLSDAQLAYAADDVRHLLELHADLAAALAAPAAQASAPAAAADFTLPARDGGTVRLSELRGQVVMINFWATWCGPCRQEMPLLQQLYGKYEPLGFTLLGVNVEPDSASAQEWLKKVSVSFPILFDRDNKVSAQFGVEAMPSTVLIDREGNVRHVHRGYKPGDESTYADLVRGLVKE